MSSESYYMKDQASPYFLTFMVRAMIVGHAEDYLFSSACDYAGEKGLVQVEMV